MYLADIEVVFRIFSTILSAVVFLAACSREDPDPLPNNMNPPIDPGPACDRSIDASNSEQQMLRFESADSELTVYLLREFIEYGPGETVQYGLKSFDLDYEDMCRSLSEGSGLEYSVSHHNWADEASATIDGVKYTVEMDFEIGTSPSVWTVSIEGLKVSDGSVSLAKTALRPTGGPFGCWSCPNHLPVTITEVLLENDGSFLDEEAEAEPWVELWNPSSDAVDLSGWKIVGTGAVTGTFVFPENTTIGRHLFLVVWLDGESAEGPLHAPFRAPAREMFLRLENVSGVTAGERKFNSPGPGKSLDLDLGAGNYQELSPTPNAASVHQAG